MKKILMLMVFLTALNCLKSYSQKRYGYAVLQFRCGDHDSQKDRVYYSPVIELNTLNFPQYIAGMDPDIALYSVRYYNYAISKWFEIFLQDKYKILINDRQKYARRSHAVIYNEKNKTACDDNKTNSGCFFMNREELSKKRQDDIAKSKAAENNNSICEVIDL